MKIKCLLYIGMLVMVSLGASAQISFLDKHIADTVACRRWVDNQIASMTLKQKIGQ